MEGGLTTRSGPHDRFMPVWSSCNALFIVHLTLMTPRMGGKVVSTPIPWQCRGEEVGSQTGKGKQEKIVFLLLATGDWRAGRS